jgi:hypothetical protein
VSCPKKPACACWGVPHHRSSVEGGYICDREGSVIEQGLSRSMACEVAGESSWGLLLFHRGSGFICGVDAAMGESGGGRRGRVFFLNLRWVSSKLESFECKIVLGGSGIEGLSHREGLL